MRRFALADPPYLGCGAKHYAAHHAEAAACDTVEWHAALIRRLCDEYPDGWALALHTPSLQRLLALCPGDVRIGAWVKPFCAWKANVKPAYAWEPLIWRGGRKRDPKALDTPRDWLACSITMRRGLAGAKPAQWTRWVLSLLNAEPGDTIDDLFPGSGAITAAIDQWRAAARGEVQLPLFLEAVA